VTEDCSEKREKSWLMNPLALLAAEKRACLSDSQISDFRSKVESLEF